MQSLLKYIFRFGRDNAGICFLLILVVISFGAASLHFPSARVALLIVLSATLSGVGWHFLLPPLLGREFVDSWIQIPYYGVAQIAILGAVFIGFSLDIRLYPAFNFLLALSTCLLALKYRRALMSRWASDLKSNFPRLCGVLVFGVLPIVLILISPVINPEHASSPYRIGPDLASYGMMAQHLVDGKTWADRSEEFAHYLNMDSVVEISRMADATMTWPLLYWYRWGETGATYFYHAIVGSSHVYEVAFLTLLPNYLLVGGLLIGVLTRLFAFPLSLATIIGVALLLNANLLNLWYEGFYGQLFALPYVFAAFIWLLKMQRRTDAFQRADRAAAFKGSNIVVGVLPMLVILSSYAEGLFFVISVCIAGAIFLDRIAYGRFDGPLYAAFLLTSTAACLALAPLGFLGEWFELALRNLAEAGGNGYAQPMWAMFGEIFGVLNLYREYSGYDPRQGVFRHPDETIASGLLAVLFLANISGYAIETRAKSSGRALLLAPYMLVAAMYLLYAQVAPSNYGYMKIYTSLLPLLVLATCVAIRSGCESRSAVRNGISVCCLMLLPASVLGGIDYITTYNQSSRTISSAQMDLQRFTPAPGEGKAVLLPSPGTYRTEQDVFMLGATLPMTWINPYAFRRYNTFYGLQDARVLVLAGVNERVRYQGRYREVFANADYVILDTGRTLASGMFYDQRRKSVWLNTDAYFPARNSSP